MIFFIRHKFWFLFGLFFGLSLFILGKLYFSKADFWWGLIGAKAENLLGSRLECKVVKWCGKPSKYSSICAFDCETRDKALYAARINNHLFSGAVEIFDWGVRKLAKRNKQYFPRIPYMVNSFVYTNGNILNKIQIQEIKLNRQNFIGQHWKVEAESQKKDIVISGLIGDSSDFLVKLNQFAFPKFSLNGQVEISNEAFKRKPIIFKTNNLNFIFKNLPFKKLNLTGNATTNNNWNEINQIENLDLKLDQKLQITQIPKTTEFKIQNFEIAELKDYLQILKLPYKLPDLKGNLQGKIWLPSFKKQSLPKAEISLWTDNLQIRLAPTDIYLGLIRGQIRFNLKKQILLANLFMVDFPLSKLNNYLQAKTKNQLNILGGSAKANIFYKAKNKVFQNKLEIKNLKAEYQKIGVNNGQAEFFIMENFNNLKGNFQAELMNKNNLVNGNVNLELSSSNGEIQVLAKQLILDEILNKLLKQNIKLKIKNLNSKIPIKNKIINSFSGQTQIESGEFIMPKNNIGKINIESGNINFNEKNLNLNDILLTKNKNEKINLDLKINLIQKKLIDLMAKGIIEFKSVTSFLALPIKEEVGFLNVDLKVQNQELKNANFNLENINFKSKQNLMIKNLNGLINYDLKQKNYKVDQICLENDKYGNTCLNGFFQLDQKFNLLALNLDLDGIFKPNLKVKNTNFDISELPFKSKVEFEPLEKSFLIDFEGLEKNNYIYLNALFKPNFKDINKSFFKINDSEFLLPGINIAARGEGFLQNFKVKVFSEPSINLSQISKDISGYISFWLEADKVNLFDRKTFWNNSKISVKTNNSQTISLGKAELSELESYFEAKEGEGFATLIIGKGRLMNLPFDNLNASFKLKNNDLKFNALDFSAASGKINLKGKLNLISNEGNFTGTAKGLDIGKIAKGLTDQRGFSGIGDFTFAIDGHLQSLIANKKPIFGSGSFDLRNGRTSHVLSLQKKLNLANFVFGGPLALNLNSVLEVLAPTENGYYKSLKGNWLIDQDLIIIPAALYKGENELNLNTSGFFNRKTNKMNFNFIGSIPRIPIRLDHAGRRAETLNVFSQFNVVNVLGQFPVLNAVFDPRPRVFKFTMKGNGGESNELNSYASRTFTWLDSALYKKLPMPEPPKKKL